MADKSVTVGNPIGDVRRRCAPHSIRGGRRSVVGRPGQRAEIRVDMYNRSVPGRVDSIASATGSKLSLLPPENATGNFVKVVQRIPVKILVDPQDGLILRPGMNVDATIFTK